MNVGKRFTFDWSAYHAVWHDTPYDRAASSLFAEQAPRFITLYVNHVLGEIHSTKVHKVLCHIMSAIRWHGDLQNGNTAGNEYEHKHDKPFYSRNNDHLGDFTNQLVVHARGSHAALRPLDDADGRRHGGGSGGPQGRNEVSTPNACRGGGDTGACTSSPRTSSFYHLQETTVAELEARPDLAGLSSILGQPRHSKVCLLSSTKLHAIMDRGTLTCKSCTRQTKTMVFSTGLRGTKLCSTKRQSFRKAL